MLDTLEKISKILATLALPVVLLLIGNWYSSSQKDKDLGQKYVEIAVGILSQEPTVDNATLRRWAADNVNRYAEVKLGADLVERLITQDALPPPISAPLPSGFRAFDGVRAVSRIIVSDAGSQSVDGILATLPQVGASYHYLVGTDGSVRSLVAENDIAFHTSRANTDSIGIGLAHLGGEPYPELQVRALARLVEEIAGRHGLGPEAVVSKAEVDPRRRSDFATIADEVRRGVAVAPAQ